MEHKMKIYWINFKYWLIGVKNKIKPKIEAIAVPCVICVSFWAFGVLTATWFFEDKCKDGFVQIFSQGYYCSKRSYYYGAEIKKGIR